MNRVLSVLGVGLLLVVVPGCSHRYKFRVECTVQDSTTGQPLDEVRVAIDTFALPGESVTAGQGKEIGKTNQSGRVEHLLEVNEGSQPTRQRRWLLRSSRDGYQTEQVDVSPPEWPKTSGQVVPLVLLVRLKPMPTDQPR